MLCHQGECVLMQPVMLDGLSGSIQITTHLVNNSYIIINSIIIIFYLPRYNLAVLAVFHVYEADSVISYCWLLCVRREICTVMGTVLVCAVIYSSASVCFSFCCTFLFPFKHICVSTQSAGAAQASVSATESPRIRSQTREHVTYVPAIVSVQSHTALSWWHEERGETHALLEDNYFLHSWLI